MKLRLHHITFIIITLLFGIASCTDDFIFDDSYIGKGRSTISMTLNFREFTETETRSRAAGDKYDFIRSLFVIVYNEAGTEVIDKELFSVSPTDNTQVLSTMSLPFGKYQIYAVANMDDLAGYDYSTVSKLKTIKLQWEQSTTGAPGDNDQMMGFFLPVGKESENPVITINNFNVSLKADLVRAASKVTVAYDGRKLKDGVTIQIKSVSIKDIASGCFLGAPSTVGENGFTMITEGEKVTYPSGSQISNQSPFFPVTGNTDADGGPVWSGSNDPHSHTSDYSLFFYENMQGTGPDKRQEFDKDGNLVNPDEGKPMANGTYIEVDAHYTSNNPERPGVGNIKYRFMLGKNVTTNYDAERNHHYKLTLVFKGFADDPDWKIELEQFLEAPGDQHVDYMGEKFYPDESIPNLGHTFSDDVYAIKSYAKNIETGETVGVPYEISYSTDGGVTFGTDKKPAWLTVETPALDANHSANIKFSYGQNTPDTYTVNGLMTGTSGSAGAPTDLTGGGETANCYIVSKKGYYKFPLVYGNGVYSGVTSGVSTDSDNDSWGVQKGNPTGDLGTFKNYLEGEMVEGNNVGNEIKSKYILDDIYTQRDKTIPPAKTTTSKGLSADVVWEDVSYLVTNIKYDPNAYTNGGITFTVGNGTAPIKEGNAVIALKDPDGNIMWSWHIWVTTDKFKDEWAMTLTDNYSTWLPSYKIMPVCLGWCSGGKELKYFKKRECQVRITAGELSKTIKVIQEPHLAVPTGSAPYYQWGRKDPFVGARPGLTGGNIWGWEGYDKNLNNIWWYYDEATDEYVESTDAPPVLNPDATDDAHKTRPYTKDILWKLIRNPRTWNDPRCKGSSGAWQSDDLIYANLWADGQKTCYDPCPAGFRVSPYETFAVTVRQSAGWSVTDSKFWFNVSPSRMLAGYKSYMVDFYTNSEKYISFGLPEIGYRDYDNLAKITDYSSGFVWLARNINSNNSYYFRYWLENVTESNNTLGGNSIVAPFFGFYCTDGYPVLPTAVVPRVPLF